MRMHGPPEGLNKKLVAIVVPIYKKEIAREESISLKHLIHFIGQHDKYFVVPKRLETNRDGFAIKTFDNRFFTSAAAYSSLLLSRELYETFSEYKYILVYQLDCLVFSDELEAWCETDLDYIGAPWFRSKTDPAEGFSRVGNGGLSLRKVKSFLAVIDSQKCFGKPVSHWGDFFSNSLDDIQSLPMPQRYLKKLKVVREIRKGAQWYTSRYSLNEDRFWSDRAKLFYPDFKVAPTEVAVRFSFERFPRYCFEKNSHQLPFGCHAWSKYDRAFWEPYLLR
jgi:hypothetical protein